MLIETSSVNTGFGDDDDDGRDKIRLLYCVIVGTFIPANILIFISNIIHNNCIVNESPQYISFILLIYCFIFSLVALKFLALNPYLILYPYFSLNSEEFTSYIHSKNAVLSNDVPLNISVNFVFAVSVSVFAAIIKSSNVSPILFRKPITLFA